MVRRLARIDLPRTNGGVSMKLLLTGGRGYVGSVIGPMPVGARHDITGVDTDLYRRSTFGTWREQAPKTVHWAEAARLPKDKRRCGAS